ncbi:MAG TPA: PRC-barrel domain-containing protein [Tissierellales bacterium]|nr:PRC-barrel domain-containing protein [Tissierellales bacterium]
MLKYSELLISNLIDKENKTPIGEIVNVAFSEEFKRIVGLIVKNDKLYKNKILLPIENIVDIDKDSIIIVNENELKKEKPYEEKEINLVDWEVITEKLECIGYVKDMVIKKEDGKIIGFIISEGIIEDIVKGRKFLSSSKIIEINEKSIVIEKEDIKDIGKNGQCYKKIIELED